MKTLFLSLFAVVANVMCHINAAEMMDISSYPTLGDPKSPVQVVAFLEPKCPDSKKYNNESFPKLQSEFINTNKISYSVIVTSFIPQSMPAAIALLCVYHQDANKPNAILFFKYLNYIYQNQPSERDNWATIEAMQKFAAKASSDIDQNKLKACIEKGAFEAEIKKNTALGDKMMGHLSTPTIYVNGVKIENSDDTINFDNLKNAIQKELDSKKSK
ncbi:MAG: DsbA family protein [Parachlamydiaceae bacterium]|nr:DsbA family protein [Parachlamydiaceae bacterium]